MTAIASTGRQSIPAALIMTVGMAIVIGSALALEHMWGYVPCELCLKERIPYYVGIPAAILAIVSAAMRMPVGVTRIFLGIAVIAMLVGTGLSIYHAGVEWKFWEGPSSCTSSIDSIAKSSKDLLSDLSNQHGPSCSDAALRIAGLSLAGWNVVATLVLATIGVFAARKA
jgi:disulfide bond formation protein DsbB